MNTGPYPVKIGLCVDKADFDKNAKRYGWTDDFPDDEAHIVAVTEGCFVITLNDEWRKAPLVRRLGMVTHEAVHAWQMTVFHMGEEECPGHEVEAYSIQWITQWLLSELLKLKYLPEVS